MKDRLSAFWAAVRRGNFDFKTWWKKWLVALLVGVLWAGLTTELLLIVTVKHPAEAPPPNELTWLVAGQVMFGSLFVFGPRLWLAVTTATVIVGYLWNPFGLNAPPHDLFFVETVFSATVVGICVFLANIIRRVVLAWWYDLPEPAPRPDELSHKIPEWVYLAFIVWMAFSILWKYWPWSLVWMPIVAAVALGLEGLFEKSAPPPLPPQKPGDAKFATDDELKSAGIIDER
jgi:hypothetical protein